MFCLIVLNTCTHVNLFYKNDKDVISAGHFQIISDITSKLHPILQAEADNTALSASQYQMDCNLF